MKCPQCNCHFDGKRCPNCGAKARYTEKQQTQRFCLWGFRSKKAWKMVLSGFYLLFCVILLIGAVTQKRPPALPTPDYRIDLATNLLTLLLFLSPYIFLSDSPLRDRLPVFKKKNLRTDCCGLIIVVFIIFTGIGLLDELHTDAYKADQENHAYIITESTPASCEESGECHYECNFCGAGYIDTIDPLGHQMQILSEAPDGTTTSVCTRCGKMQTTTP